MRALVIDDSNSTRHVLRRYLEGVGFEVREANNGKDALSMLLTESAVELVLVDWSMPEMNGLEFLTAVRAIPRFDDMKIVIITAKCEMANIQEGLASGATEYIMKPFTRDIILTKLQMLGF